MMQRCSNAVFLFMFILAVACGEKIEPGTTEPSPPVVRALEVITAEPEDRPRFYEAVGTVRAGTSSHLSSKLMGRILETRVDEGVRVKKGDVLLVMERRRVEAELRRAAAGLEEARKALNAARSARDAAEAEETLARVTRERYLALKREASVSDQEFDEVVARSDRAKAALERTEMGVQAAAARVVQAEAALSAAEVIRDDATVTAPHDGLITGKLVDEGDLAVPGTPLLTLETTGGYRVEMEVPETYLPYVHAGQRVRVTVPALEGGVMEGTVRTVVPAANPKTRSFLVKVALSADSRVRSGMFARVEVPLGQRQRLLIPRGAAVHRGQLTGLYLLDRENIARFRLIRLGRSFGDQVEVLSGLRPGERYVAKPSPGIHDGVRVEVGT